MKSSRFFLFLLLFLVLFGVGFFLTSNTLDPDLGWHLRTGQLILERGGAPMQDWYSYTMPLFPWTDHEWLFQVLIATLGGADPTRRAVAWGWLCCALTAVLALLLWRDLSDRDGALGLPGPARAAPRSPSPPAPPPPWSWPPARHTWGSPGRKHPAPRPRPAPPLR